MTLSVVGASLIDTMDDLLFNHFDKRGGLMLEGIGKTEIVILILMVQINFQAFSHHVSLKVMLKMTVSLKSSSLQH